MTLRLSPPLAFRLSEFATSYGKLLRATSTGPLWAWLVCVIFLKEAQRGQEVVRRKPVL